MHLGVERVGLWPERGFIMGAAKSPGAKSVGRWRVLGQGLAEYALILALLVIVAILMVTYLGDVVSNGMYSRISSGLPGP